MDLPDIELVIQWKATCELCTLWQRFGRAARGPGREATAILLVEKKDTAEERVKKAGRAAKRKKNKETGTGIKRKAEIGKQIERKRPALADRSTNAVSDRGSSDNEDNDNERIGPIGLEECRARYANQERPQVVQVRGCRGPQVGSALDNFINPEGRFPCRRTIIMLFFGNDKTRGSCRVRRVCN